MDQDKKNREDAFQLSDFNDFAVEVLLDERALAARWGISIKTLQNNRVYGTGIPFLKLGRSVRYRLSDVLTAERAALRSSTSEGVD